MQSLEATTSGDLDVIANRSELLSYVASILAGEIEALPDIEGRGRLYQAVRHIQMGAEDLADALVHVRGGCGG